MSSLTVIMITGSDGERTARRLSVSRPSISGMCMSSSTRRLGGHARVVAGGPQLLGQLHRGPERQRRAHPYRHAGTSHQEHARRMPFLLQALDGGLALLGVLQRGHLYREELGRRLLAEADGGEAGLVELGLHALRVLGQGEGAEGKGV